MSVERGDSPSSEVEDLINTPSIIELLKLVKERDDLRSLDSVQDRFRIACAENDLIEGYKQADWVDAFDKFVSGLKDINFNQKYALTLDDWGIPLNVHGVDNHRDHVHLPEPNRYDYQVAHHLKIHFTLIEPKVKDAKLPKKVDILFRRTESLGPDEVEIWYELGNRQLVAALSEEELVYYNSELEITQFRFGTEFAFDEECNVYYEVRDMEHRLITVYQKNMRTNSEPELVHAFQDIYCVICMGVRGGKLYALLNVTLNPDLIRRIDCVDLATRRVISTGSSMPLDVDRATVPFENGVVFKDRYSRSYAYQPNGDRLGLKVIPSTLRTQLNRYSFVHQREILDTYQLKTFSFVDGKMVENHIGEVDQKTIIIRLTDHVFAVLQRQRRCIYYEEKPGTKPILIHTDTRATPMRQLGHRWAPLEYESRYS